MDFHLRTPMYFLLSNLSFMDVCYTSITVPQVMVILFLNPPVISLRACISQLYFFLTLAASESSLLAMMAYDRYVAICSPLRYAAIMNKEACLQMTAGTWLIGCIYGAIHTINTFRLPFCGPKILNHFFCDIPPLLKLSCINTYSNEVTIFAVGGFLMLGCFLLICGSYMNILLSVLKIPKGVGRGKAFSTCISHLIVVLLFYGSGSFMYLRPKSNLLADKEWILSIFYTSITPLLNPLIYSLRNKDIQKAIVKQINYKIMHRFR
ncbi:olfactory receptor 2D3-like [Pelobates fuscus]|uniref:olfactory receptor 2D3-like n=1 Tax=Pelobates fuscus TaxID=191477 RepID=UPI002FE4DDE4